jgi:hypothetical protein
MYTCGPTVYAEAHLGNFRAFLTYDILKRVLVKVYDKEVSVGDEGARRLARKLGSCKDAFYNVLAHTPTAYCCYNSQPSNPPHLSTPPPKLLTSGGSCLQSDRRG